MNSHRSPEVEVPLTVNEPLSAAYNDEGQEDFARALTQLERSDSFCMSQYDIAEHVTGFLPPWHTGEPDSALVRVVEQGQLPRRRARALELGCGYGHSAAYLAEQGYERVVGVDLAIPAIGHARELARRRGLSERVRFICYDAFALPVPAQPFDLVYDNTIFNNAGVHACSTRAQYLSMLRRVLSSEGRLLLVFAHDEASKDGFSSRVPGLPTTSPAQIRACFEGTSILESLALEPVQYDLMRGPAGQRSRVPHPGGYAILRPTW